MRVLLAADAGMCFGVRRALALAGQAADKAAAAAVRVRLLGELAHNRQMDDWLAAAGIGQGRPEELGPGDIAILPSHGKGPALYAELTAKGCEIVDGTCPLVASAREKALAAKASGHFILILGDERHDEVAAYREWLGDSCLIVPEPTTEFFSPLPENLAVMAQTTESPDRFQQFAARWREGGPAPLVLDTICAATKRRREAAAALAGEVDAFLVIGGRHSANTQNLGEYCRTLRRRTYMVESKDDIDPAWFAGIKSLGITAGASTPEWIIKEVLEMTDEFKDQGQQGFGPEAQSAEMEREQALAGEPTPSPADVTSPKEAVDGEENRESAPAAEAAEIAPVAGLEQAPEQVQAEVQVEAATEAQAEAQAETQAGAAAEAQAETAAEAQAETQAGAAAEAQAEAATEAQAEAATEAQVEAQAEARVEAAAETQAEAAAEAQEDTDSEGDFSALEAKMSCRAYRPGDFVEGTVVKVSSDEILVDIGYKSEGIIPAFEMAFAKVDLPSVARLGDKIIAEVIKEDREGNIILSRKNAISEEKLRALEAAFAKGEPVQATVIEVVKGGLLVDMGLRGLARGFVPASQVDRRFVKNLDDYLNQTLDFKILEFSRGGRQPRVVLSRKVLLEIESRKARRAFWETAEEGQVRRGIVRRLTNFGAFVDVGGCDGLLHVSEMAWGKVGKPSDIMSVDDELDVCLVKLDRAKDKVSLSLRKLLPNPWDTAAEKYRVDEIYTGRVMRNVTFGAFIQLEPGLDGLAHISQLANFRLNKVEDVLLEGMEVQVKVVDIDMVHRRISLSVKDVMDLPLLAREEAPAKETPAKEAPAKNEKADEAAERPRKRRAKARAGAEAGAGAEAEAEAGAEASADAGVEAGAEAEAVTDAGAEAGAGAKASAGASADAGADAGAEAEAATDAGVEAGAGAGADSEAEAEAGGDAGTAANAAEAETEAKA